METRIRLGLKEFMAANLSLGPPGSSDQWFDTMDSTRHFE